jgi:hypothetical protein
MSSTSWENNQLKPYLEEFNLVPVENRVPGATRGAAVPSQEWWGAYRDLNAAPSSYGAMSTGPNTTSTPAADTTAGNVVVDAGFGGMQQ